jgi:hypothetical protein
MKIRLYDDSKACTVYVKAYNPKTKELKTTTDIKEAKTYKSAQGAESSARSIFNLYLEGKTNYVFQHGKYRK